MSIRTWWTRRRTPDHGSITIRIDGTPTTVTYPYTGGTLVVTPTSLDPIQIRINPQHDPTP